MPGLASVAMHLAEGVCKEQIEEEDLNHCGSRMEAAVIPPSSSFPLGRDAGVQEPELCMAAGLPIRAAD